MSNPAQIRGEPLALHQAVTASEANLRVPTVHGSPSASRTSDWSALARVWPPDPTPGGIFLAWSGFLLSASPKLSSPHQPTSQLHSWACSDAPVQAEPSSPPLSPTQEGSTASFTSAHPVLDSRLRSLAPRFPRQA
ncbi:hypothetical protein MRS44_000709 [Fusarium solani]|uniref:uncharacterized protein n=1 Tax=Fusarium solani TaxID=169388 RepID=UPI0032C4889C|nr:hypothetical protein MRS44_000709 [Fusarium solani]